LSSAPFKPIAGFALRGPSLRLVFAQHCWTARWRSHNPTSEAVRFGPRCEEIRLPKDSYAETEEPYQTVRWAPLQALVTSEFKCVRSTQPVSYYLSQDPGEVHDLAHEESAQMQTIEQSFSQWDISMPQSVAQSALLTDRERSALSSLEYAAHGQPGAKRSRLLLLKPVQTGNPAQIALRQRVIRSRIIF